jgi:hypothetical protein
MHRLRISREFNKASTIDLLSRCQRTRVFCEMLLQGNVMVELRSGRMEGVEGSLGW